MAPADDSGTTGGGRRPDLRRGWPTGSATGSTDPGLLGRGPGPPVVVRRAGRAGLQRAPRVPGRRRPRAWWWPSTPSGTHPELSDGHAVQGPGLGGQHPGPGRGGPGPGHPRPPPAGQGARTSRAAGPRSRSWPTPSRRSSAPSTSTAGWRGRPDLVLSLLRDRIAVAVGEPGESDHKSRLQEEAVRLGRGVPRYEVEGFGPDHARRYLATVYVAGQRLGTGEGRSKKDAEQVAAQVACGSLEVERGGGNA